MYTFSNKALKILNNRTFNTCEKRIGLIPQLISEYAIETSDPEFFTELTAWLTIDVNQSDSAVKTCAEPLFESLKSNSKGFSKLIEEHPDAMGGYLVEVLRCYNFAKHDTGTIQWFISFFKKNGYKIEGNPDACAKHATFNNLTYKTGGIIVMTPF